jgi:hypothetical protein
MTELNIPGFTAEASLVDAGISFEQNEWLIMYIPNIVRSRYIRPPTCSELKGQCRRNRGFWCPQSDCGFCVIGDDHDFCGSCNRQCSDNQVCKGKKCVSCPPTKPNSCGNVCTNISNDPANCGGCYQPCGYIPNGFYTCLAGDCLEHCNESYPVIPCYDYGQGRVICVNIQTDPNNCGRCGKVCTGGKTCQSGTCNCPTGQSLSNGMCCPNGLTNCGGTCTDTSKDLNNCGGCGDSHGNNVCFPDPNTHTTNPNACSYPGHPLGSLPACASGTACNRYGVNCICVSPGVSNCANLCIANNQVVPC